MKKGWVNTKIGYMYLAVIRFDPMGKVWILYFCSCKEHRRICRGTANPTDAAYLTNNRRMVKRLFKVTKGYRHVSTK